MRRATAIRVAEMMGELWTWSGRIGRGRFAAWGFALLAVKLLGDIVLSELVFSCSWSPTVYWFPGRAMLEAEEHEQRWLVALSAWSLPFLAAGLALTVRRLRAIGWSPLLAVMFAVPVANLIFFAVLLLTPDREAPLPGARLPSWLDRTIPRGALACAALAALVSLALGGSLTWLGVAVLRMYGIALFVVQPLVVGLISAWLWNHHECRTRRSTLGVATNAYLLCSAALLLIGLEGAVCVLMVLPLGLPVTLIGALIGWHVCQVTPQRQPHAGRTLSGLVLMVPLAMTLEYADRPPPPSAAVTSVIEVDAPPERVWAHVIAFGEIEAPPEALFRLGIACPLRATIDGQGPGALRRCTFTTGSFLEPIEVWDEPHRLRFAVTENPPTMHEWSPWGELAAAHLHGNFVATAGEFRLVALPGGRTRLEGTTWYHQHLWPSLYWRLWSDAIVHAIHMRVLRHVKRLAEAE